MRITIKKQQTKTMKDLKTMIKHCHHQKNYQMNYVNDINVPYRGQIIQMYECQPSGFDYMILLHKNTHKSKLNDVFYSDDYCGIYSNQKHFEAYDDAIADACKIIDEHINSKQAMSALAN